MRFDGKDEQQSATSGKHQEILRCRIREAISNVSNEHGISLIDIFGALETMKLEVWDECMMAPIRQLERDYEHDDEGEEWKR